MITAPVGTFPALAKFLWLRHGFIERVPGIDVKADRPTALARLAGIHEATLPQIGIHGKKLVTAEQVHGIEVRPVDFTTGIPVPATDGMVTKDPRVCLGIYVADCGAIYVVDPVKKAIGLLHSGKKGSELGILTQAIECMIAEFGSQPSDLIVQLGPCIRPPYYEIDFAQQIRAQAEAAGVAEYHDCGICTASDPEKYYSYRRELGQTGRLLAVLALDEMAE